MMNETQDQQAAAAASKVRGPGRAPKSIFAKDTSVPIERSQAEIVSILRKYGARGYNYGCIDDVPDPENANKTIRLERIEFHVHDRKIRFMLALPSHSEAERTNTGKRRAADKIEKAWEQICRQKWRSLCLCIKAKLETVAAGISTFEEEFMAQTVVEGTDKTTAQILRPWLLGKDKFEGALRLTFNPNVKT